MAEVSEPPIISAPETLTLDEFVALADEPKMSAAVDYLFSKAKTGFNPNRDLLVISETHLDEAKQFDKDGWLSQIAKSVVVFSDDLKNVAIVSA